MFCFAVCVLFFFFSFFFFCFFFSFFSVFLLLLKSEKSDVFFFFSSFLFFSLYVELFFYFTGRFPYQVRWSKYDGWQRSIQKVTIPVVGDGVTREVQLALGMRDSSFFPQGIVTGRRYNYLFKYLKLHASTRSQQQEKRGGGGGGGAATTTTTNLTNQEEEGKKKTFSASK